MRYDTIADIYSANQKIREHLMRTVSEISEAEADTIPEGEKWSIRQIVEHVAMVDHGIARICRKLVSAAKEAGKASNGVAMLSPEFVAKAADQTAKLEAPDHVQPSGEIAISDSIERMTQNQAAYASLRSDLESYDLSGPKFPHPYFGPLTAAEWLALVGGHEMRHNRQILRVLKSIR